MAERGKSKPVVFLTGASGSMGHEAFRLLWEKRDRYDIVLLQRPSRRNKRLFKPYEKTAGISPIRGRGTVEGDGLKIVWGDATSRSDLREACRGIDWCLSPMGLISPEADRNPEQAHRVNTVAVRHLVETLEEEGRDHVKLVYIGTIAEYGDRLAPIHHGRVGDPVFPSVFDRYATSKIAGELAVMESKLRWWVSLRQTFIMIPDLFSLMDPIMFHQPIDSYMENITARDAGRALVKCLDMEGRAGFWRRCFNLAGGPECRVTFFEFLERIYALLGLDPRRVMERKWFALKNFHMQFYEDSHELNEALGHWEGGETMEDYYRQVWEHLPAAMKGVAALNKKLPPFRRLVEVATALQLKHLAKKKDGTLHWIEKRLDDYVEAFYGGYDRYEEIPDWETDLPNLEIERPYVRLDHGYDESKESLDIDDLRGAAEFRGGALVSEHWDGDMHEPLEWRCCLGHTFTMRPYTVLKGGHWCFDCLGPPWRYEEIQKKSPFFAQLVSPRIPEAAAGEVSDASS
jgi:nucleoside-diphosphate-sugar epimerase